MKVRVDGRTVYKKRKTKAQLSLRKECEEWVQKGLELRGKLVIRIVQLGGLVPPPHPPFAADDAETRILLLLAKVEQLEMPKNVGRPESYREDPEPLNLPVKVPEGMDTPL